MFNDFTDSSCYFTISAWGARILIGAALGTAQIAAVAGAPGAATETSMVLLDLQNELILGTQLSPMMAACLDDEAAGGWVLPSNAQIEISDRAQQRKQRALENCSFPIPDLAVIDSPRKTSEALRRGFADQLQARLALEDAKKHARDCIAGQANAEGFKRCLLANTETTVDEGSWPRWFTLFVRYQAAR